MNKLKIALCQVDTEWENALVTLAKIEPTIRKFCLKHSPDILVLPETFSTGFTMNPLCAEPSDGASATWLRRTAKEINVALVASVPTLIGGDRFNRCYFVTPQGEEFTYDKRHLFNPSGEGKTYTPGTRRCTVPYKGWNIELNVCYDLRFPVWSRNEGNRYDLLINIANWPKTRIDAANTLLPARAIENCSYALFCNRVGKDATCKYNGCSLITDYFGKKIGCRKWVDGTKFIIAKLDKDSLDKFREKFPAWKDSDNFNINI